MTLCGGRVASGPVLAQIHMILTLILQCGQILRVLGISHVLGCSDECFSSEEHPMLDEETAEGQNCEKSPFSSWKMTAFFKSKLDWKILPQEELFRGSENLIFHSSLLY